jgi:hypothetical protein
MLVTPSYGGFRMTTLSWVSGRGAASEACPRAGIGLLQRAPGGVGDCAPRLEPRA